MIESISHDRGEESLESKARWFRSLTIQERVDYFCGMAKFVRELNPRVIEQKNRDARPVCGSYQVLELPRG
jgi:hypothetical protein